MRSELLFLGAVVRQLASDKQDARLARYYLSQDGIILHHLTDYDLNDKVSRDTN
jgi:hypothetical protein